MWRAEKIVHNPTSHEEHGFVSSEKKKKITITTDANVLPVMHMDGEILFRAPHFGMSGVVKENIIRTFGSAVEDFYDRHYGTK